MRHALVVGIDAYPSDPLRYCVDDATGIAEVLRSKEYGFSVQCLLDGEATRKNVRSALDSLFATPAEVLLFYFAGHGTATDLGGYLDTVDIGDLEDGVTLDVLRRYAQVRLPADSSLIYLLDCCHAGQGSVRSAGATVRLKPYDIRTELAALGGSGRVLLAACQHNELSYEYAKYGHGAFTFYLLEGLSGYAADSSGDVTAMSLYDHASRPFQSDPLQKPVFSGDLVGRFVLGSGFTPVGTAAASLSALQSAESEAETLLNGFHTELTQLKRDPSFWRTVGFRQAAASLEAILRWFEGRLHKTAGLGSRPRFQSLLKDLRLRQAELCQLSSGMITAEGEVFEALGHGNFGAVWRVRSATVGLPDLAYKVFHAQDLDDDEKVSRFKHGFHAMEQMDHPRIVRVHRLTQCPFGYYMDYVSGSNLRRFVGTFDEPIDNLGLLITVAETLNHAHGRNVVHRDLKPENVLMTFEAGKHWVAYLTDFDLAWFSTATQLTKSALGATFYASPEQIDKPGSASSRAKTTDVFSFGQLMYFVFCTSDPPRDNAIPALQARLRAGWSQAAAQRLVELFSACVQHSPAKRPADFRSIIDELVRIRALLAHDPEAHLSGDVFVREIAFALVGLGSQLDAQNSFLTLSEKIRIRIETSGVDEGGRVEVSVHCLEPPAIPGVNHQRMRELLLSRVETAMHDHPNAQKRTGDNLPFQVYLDVREKLDRNGATRLSILLGRVTDAIEGLA